MPMLLAAMNRRLPGSRILHSGPGSPFAAFSPRFFHKYCIFVKNSVQLLCLILLLGTMSFIMNQRSKGISTAGVRVFTRLRIYIPPLLDERGGLESILQPCFSPTKVRTTVKHTCSTRRWYGTGSSLMRSCSEENVPVSIWASNNVPNGEGSEPHGKFQQSRSTWS